MNATCVSLCLPCFFWVDNSTDAIILSKSTCPDYSLPFTRTKVVRSSGLYGAFINSKGTQCLHHIFLQIPSRQSESLLYTPGTKTPKLLNRDLEAGREVVEFKCYLERPFALFWRALFFTM